MPPLQRAILSAICYHDLFLYPLTREEISRWLWQYRAAPTDIIIALETLLDQRRLETLRGYYFLPGQEAIVGRRHRSMLLVEKKIAIARRAAQKIRWLPFVQGMYICNTVAQGSAEKDSDIDVCIIVRQKRLWFTRLAVTLLLSLCRLRRSGRKIADRVCLSFYITDNALDLSLIALSPPDVYLAHWVHELMPLYDRGERYRHLRQANSWAARDLPQAPAITLSERYRIADSGWSMPLRKILESVWGAGYGSLLETEAKALQRTRMKRHSSPASKADRSVVTSDTMLKFHEHDRRAEFKTAWEARLTQSAL